MTSDVTQEEQDVPSGARQYGRATRAAAGAGRRPLRALVVSPQPFYSPRGTPLSIYYRTLITAEQMVDVDLLTYGEGFDVAIDGVRIHRIPRFAWLGDVPVGPSRLKLFLDVFLFAWVAAFLVRRRYDFVHAHEEAIFFCQMLKPLFHVKLVYDMHSCLPRQLSNFGFTKSRFLIGAFERLERAAISTSDAVITICPDLAEYVLGRIDDPGKHFLIENSIFEDVKLARGPGGTERAGPKPGADPPLPGDRPVVVYAGTLEPYQGIDLLLQAFDLVRRDQPDAFLLVVGGNPDQVTAYANQARALGIAADCRFTGRLPQAEARRLVARAVVQVSPRTHGTNTPLKVYEQLASGIPLVATDIYSHRQVLDDDVAFLTEPEPAAFARGILDALTRPDEGAARVAAAQRLYAEKYSREVYVGKMCRLLDRLA